MVSTAEDHFPEVSATVTVVKAHWSVVALYDILKPWLTEHVQSKAMAQGWDDGMRLVAVGHGTAVGVDTPAWLGTHWHRGKAMIIQQR